MGLFNLEEVILCLVDANLLSVCFPK